VSLSLTQKQKNKLWFEGNLFWKLHAGQVPIYNTLRRLPKTTREALVFCARRFGKSYLGDIMGVEDCIRNPGVNVYIIAPSRRQAGEIVRPIMRKIMMDMPKGLIIPTSQYKYKFSNGSELILAGFDSALESMRGMDAYSIYIEETGQATSNLDEYLYMFLSVYMPTLQHSRGRITHLTTSSPLVDHPLHIHTLPAARLNNAFFVFTIRDNPLLSEVDIEEEIISLGGADSPHVRRELFCEIVRDDSIVAVPAFDERLHVAPIYHRPHANYLVAGDFGGSRDMHFFLLMMFSHDLGVPAVIDEQWYKPNTSTGLMIPELKKKWDVHTERRVMDVPSQTRIDMCALDYSSMIPIKEGFVETLTYIRDIFFRDGIVIDPRCVKLIETLRSGTLNDARTDWARTPTLGHCDGIMATVYGYRLLDTFSDSRPKRKNRQNVHYQGDQ
jgi:hypothetical protein